MAELGKGYFGEICQKLGVPAWILAGVIGYFLYKYFGKK